MAMKSAHVSDVPNHLLDQVPDKDNTSLSSTLRNHCSTISADVGREDEVALARRMTMHKWSSSKFMVVGHRGSGMNHLILLPDHDDNHQDSYNKGNIMKYYSSCIKENSILSFQYAASIPNNNIHFIEFDVQVTKDDCPVIFHDNFIFSKDDNGNIVGKRVTDLNSDEFLSYGPPRRESTAKKVKKPLYRKTDDGTNIIEWKVEQDDSLCTLQDVFTSINDQSLGFDIGLKFDDHLIYSQEQLIHILEVIINVVNQYGGGDRPIVFSSFNPDAVKIMRRLQQNYPVFFITKGGTEIYEDPRRNSLEAAVKLCIDAGLDGIVCQVTAIFEDPDMVDKIKESNLYLLTFGHLNNVWENVYVQYLMGVDGVIVDSVQEISEAVSEFTKPRKGDRI